MFFSRKKEEISRVNPGFEPEERRTPKAGYILLFLMFLSALFFGWRALDDLQDVPAKPEALSSCAAQFIQYDWSDSIQYNYERYAPPDVAYEESLYPRKPDKGCLFSSYEVKYGVPAVYEKRKAIELRFNNLQLQLQQIVVSLSDYERQYNLALQEKIADEQRKLYPIPVIQQNLENARRVKADLEIKIDQARAELKSYDEQLKTLYREVMQDYRTATRWYEFKVFLLEAIFVFPFFLLVLWFYRRLLGKNSPYTIIATALVGVASVLAFRILIVWFWSLFLARLIQAIWEFIQSFALLKSIVFYGGMFLSIALFGGAVYFLQKHIFDPRRVAIRRLREKQCPHCQVSLDLSSEFCPNCGRKIREACTVCHKERWVDFIYCQHCNAPKSQ